MRRLERNVTFADLRGLVDEPKMLQSPFAFIRLPMFSFACGSIGTDRKQIPVAAFSERAAWNSTDGPSSVFRPRGRAIVRGSSQQWVAQGGTPWAGGQLVKYSFIHHEEPSCSTSCARPFDVKSHPSRGIATKSARGEYRVRSAHKDYTHQHRPNIPIQEKSTSSMILNPLKHLVICRLLCLLDSRVLILPNNRKP